MDFPIVHALGGPDMPDLQRQVLCDALERLVTAGEPGIIEERGSAGG